MKKELVFILAQKFMVMNEMYVSKTVFLQPRPNREITYNSDNHWDPPENAMDGLTNELYEHLPNSLHEMYENLPQFHDVVSVPLIGSLKYFNGLPLFFTDQFVDKLDTLRQNLINNL